MGDPVGDKLVDLRPIGMYTIPEISYLGRTEARLTTEKVRPTRWPRMTLCGKPRTR